jgi:methyl-accepting chemotaxis protein
LTGTSSASQVASTTQSAKAIEMASRQQAIAVEQLSGAVANIDSTAQQAERTARQVQAESEQLAAAVSRFRTDDYAGR